MKKKTQILITILLFTFTTSTNTLFSQVPDPPGEHGSNTNQPSGGSAPIGGGIIILLGLAASYGGKKIYDITSKKNKNL